MQLTPLTAVLLPCSSPISAKIFPKSTPAQWYSWTRSETCAASRCKCCGQTNSRGVLHACSPELIQPWRFSKFSLSPNFFKTRPCSLFLYPTARFSDKSLLQLISDEAAISSAQGHPTDNLKAALITGWLQAEYRLNLCPSQVFDWLFRVGPYF